MIAVMIIPTGIGCAIGGHAGDATPAAKLLAAVCDTLIVHPNVVNAADLNEMPANALYVEGSMLDRFLAGEISLRPVRSNGILLVANDPISNDTVNAAHAAYHSAGIDVTILALTTPLTMKGYVRDGVATGEIRGAAELVEQVRGLPFDALAIHTPVEVDAPAAERYMKAGGINPWGGVEAKLTRYVTRQIQRPAAHAPITLNPDWDFVSQGRVAAEMISVSNVFSVLKGLHRAPRIGPGLSWRDVDCLVSPWPCWGPPHAACITNRIPVVFVRENRTVMPGMDESIENTIMVENYWEAAGYVAALKAGIAPRSVRAGGKGGDDA